MTMLDIERNRVLMKRCILPATLAIALASCGSDSAIQEAVAKHLKDPSSAKFQDISTSAGFACAVWNSKNSFGGYGEWDTAILREKSGNWEVVTLTASVPCNSSAITKIGAKILQDEVIDLNWKIESERLRKERERNAPIEPEKKPFIGTDP